MTNNLVSILIIIGAKYLLFLVILLAVIYFIKQDRNIKKQIVLYGAIALPMIYLLAQIMARLYFDPRPFIAGHFIPLIPHLPDNGFPSDHVLLASALAMVIFYYNCKIGILLWIITLLIGISRVLAGVHHPIDIFGSIIISIIVIFPIRYLILPYLTNKFFIQTK